MRLNAYTDIGMKGVMAPPLIDPTELAAALSDPTRLGAVRLLWDGQEHCVCELMRRLDASQSRMSRHMAVLKVAGLVVDRRDAQWVRYRRNPALDSRVAAVVDAMLSLLPEPERQAA